MLGAQASRLGEAFFKLLVDSSGFASGMASAERVAQQKSAAIQGALNGIRNVSAIGFAAGAGALGLFISKGMDAEETLNLITVSLGKNKAAVDEWAKAAPAAMINTKLEAERQVAVFKNMLQGMGETAERATELGIKFTDLAADFSSFYNLRPEEAFQKISAAISGEFEPIKRLGIIINETTLKQAGWTAEMGYAARAQIILNEITRMSGPAVGDLARTIGSSTNQLRIMRANLDQAAQAIGQGLLPVVAGLAQAITPLTNALAGMNPEMAEAVGHTLLWGTVAMGLASVISQVVLGIMQYRAALATLQIQQALSNATTVATTSSTGNFLSMLTRIPPQIAIVVAALATLTAGYLAAKRAADALNAGSTGRPGGGGKRPVAEGKDASGNDTYGSSGLNITGGEYAAHRFFSFMEGLDPFRRAGGDPRNRGREFNPDVFKNLKSKQDASSEYAERRKGRPWSAPPTAINPLTAPSMADLVRSQGAASY